MVNVRMNTRNECLTANRHKKAFFATGFYLNAEPLSFEKEIHVLL